MNLAEKYGKTALVAGASEGIGAAFSRWLAAEGMDLVLIARRPEPLQHLADSLKDKYKINTTCISLDLSDPDASKKIKEELTLQEINLFVYNAALSHIGPFIKNSAENNLNIARANMITPMNLIHVFGEKMLEKGKGAVILMSSLAGFQGSGYLSVYASTKAFVRVLAESLWYEWKESGVDIIACCAGATSSPNYYNTKPEKKHFLAPRIQSPEEVVKECFSYLGRKPSFISGRGNRIASSIMQKLMPRRMAVEIMGNATRKLYRL